MQQNNIVHRFFQHYKNGQIYFVMSISRHSETEEDLVNYIQCYESKEYPFGYMWSRPLKMFLEKIDSEHNRFIRLERKEVESIIGKLISFLYDNKVNI